MKLAPLSEISDDALFSRIRTLVGVGRRVLAKLIAFLAEIEARKLHLAAAYSSLQDFCMRALGMSHGEAFRRMTAARLTRKFPSIPERIERGEIHLSALVLLRDHLTMENHDQLLSEAAGKSKEGVLEVIARHQPRPDVPPTITPIPEQKELLSAPPTEAVPARPTAMTTTSSSCSGHIEPLSPARFRIELTVSRDLREKIGRLVELMRHSNPTGDLEVVIERAIDLLLDKVERTKLGKATRPRKITVVDGGPDVHAPANPPKTGEPPVPAAPSKRTRYVPADVKRAVHARDGEQCAFVAPDGSRCPARGFLQRDHVQPFAHGGSNGVSNIRTLCAAHNDYEAKRVFGEELITARKFRQRKSLAVDSHVTAEVREIFETARRALRGMGFRQDETSRTIDAMTLHHANAPLPPLADLIREALGRLTERSS